MIFSIDSDKLDYMYVPRVKVQIIATVLIWLAISFFNTGIFIFSSEPGQMLEDFFLGLKWTPIYHSPWLIIIPWILFLARKFPLNRKITLKKISIHIFAALSVALITSFLHSYFILLRIDESFQLGNFFGNFFFYSVDRFMVYIVILLGYYSVDYYQKQNQVSLKEVQLQESINREKLNSFKNNIQPVFLLNTLKDIEEIVPNNPVLAEQLIADLARRIRVMLQNSQKSVVTISDDLNFLKSYIKILSTRLNKVIHLQESISKPDEDKKLTISLFVISILEHLLNQDKDIFQSLNTLIYETYETDNIQGVRIKLIKLVSSSVDLSKWLKSRGFTRYIHPFYKPFKEQVSTELRYYNGNLLISISFPKNSI